MKRNLTSLFSIGVLFFAIPAFASDFLSLTERRNAEILKPFLGNYQVADFIVGSTEATINIEHGQLTVWYLSGGSGVSSMLSARVELLGTSRIEQRRTSRGNATHVMSLELQDKTLTFTETQTALFWKTVESKSLTLDQNTVTFHMKRTYYKRSAGLIGSWVEDKKSWLSKMNSMDFERELFKISSKPMPFDELYKLGRTRPEAYIKITQAVTADKLGEAFENGNYEIEFCHDHLKNPKDKE